MRLKQLLGTLLSLFIASAMAAAAGTQLTAVRVVSQGDATTVTLRATGAFTHTEYRPMDDLLLVDLAGVSAPGLEGPAHPMTSGAVASYRVLGYQGASGGHISRVELGLARGASFRLAEGVHELRLMVTAPSSSASISPAAALPASAKRVESDHALAGSQLSAHPAQIRNIAVARGKDGMEVEILSNSALQPKALKLTGPDRVVVDLPNALAASRLKMIAVNAGDVKSVRMGLYQVTPPVTRVVIDLLANRDYELVQSATKLTVRLHPVGVSTSAHSELSAVAEKAEPSGPASATTAPVMAAATVLPANLPGKATDLALVQVQLQPVQPAKDPVAKAADAATKFGPDKKDTSFDLAPATSAAMLPAANTGMAFQTQGAMPTSTAAPAAKPKYTGEPISVNLKDVDLKDFFRLIHEISGLNVVLDPQVHGSLTIVLDDVPWDQALDIVLKNNGLDRQLEGNVLRIATVDTLRKEADARRGQIEAQALAVDKVTVTRFLSYAHSKDVVVTIKKFLSQRGDVVSDDRTNALIIDDIPNVIPKIDELLVKLDRKTAEVEIEARVVAATRNFARDIGTQLGFAAGINDSTNTVGGLSQVGSTNTNANPNGSQAKCCFYPVSAPGAPSTIPLFSNLAAVGPTSGLTYLLASQRFRLDFQLSLAESRGLLKILSRPRVVTQNNIQAVVRQGVKVPIVTLAQLGGPPTVTYVDAFLRLSVTPQITVENTIFLNVDVENTTPDFSRQVNGNPTLLTSQATTQVLVTDGGTVVIGGVIQTNNAVSIEQVPLLGNIPVLGNLFKRRSVSTQTQELIFFITPKIVQT